MKRLYFVIFIASNLMAVSPAMVEQPSVVPLDVVASSPPVPIEGEDGVHLLYEMRFSNFSPRGVELESIDVIEAGNVLHHYDAPSLVTMIGTPGQEKEGSAKLKIAPGSFAFVYFDTILAREAAIPSRLIHRVHIKASKPDVPASRTILDTPPLRVSRNTPIMLGPPLRGSGWVAANALSNTNDHRRTVVVVNGQARIAQRYAIDFVKLDAKGHAFRGDPSQNASWAGYGTDVLAVADGRVEALHVGVPDNSPGAAPSVPITLDTIGGNNVVLALPGGAYVFYAHLLPGSIVVQKGQQVHKGQVIAKVGNSGQSDAPHLHIHVADGASALGAEGVAYAFENFDVEGHVPSLEILESTAGWDEHPASLENGRREELPIENAVISFDGKSVN